MTDTSDQTTPSLQAGLREQLAGALIAWTYRGKEPDPETGILETVRANAYSRADAVLVVLYREWPWLRAEAEDAAPPAEAADRDRIAAAALAAVETALRDTLTDAARAEALAGITAVLPEPADRATVEADADTVATRAAQVITTMGTEIRELKHSRDRYRTAWLSARQRAQAYGEGILQHVAGRDWWKEQAHAVQAKAERADQAAVLRWAADHIENNELLPTRDLKFVRGVDWALGRLRRIADETATTDTPAAPVQHAPGKATLCPDCHAKGYAVCLDEPAAGARQVEVWPVKDSTRRYAEELRATPGKASADGHVGWECDAGAQWLVAASTPGPGALGTHHGTIYACPVHRTAAVERITGAGYEADPRSAPPGHRWNPWPCGHITVHDAQALTALTAADAQQDGAQP